MSEVGQGGDNPGGNQPVPGVFAEHTLMDLHGSIPTFVLLTPGKVNDAKVMDKIPVEAGAFYLMDKGYVAFEKLYKYFQVKGAYFVTRAKDNMSYEVIESRPVNIGSGVLSDETIRLTGYYSTKKHLDTLRLVVYEDFESGKVYRFLTNNFAIEDPLTIADPTPDTLDGTLPNIDCKIGKGINCYFRRITTRLSSG